MRTAQADRATGLTAIPPYIFLFHLVTFLVMDLADSL